jgi:carbon monoxide dehydrogenase subunit G
MSRLLVLGALLLSCLSAPALAHGPSRIKVVEKVEIAKSPDEVWAIVKNFNAIAAWLPGVASSPADHGNDVGSIRVITLASGGKVTEQLERYDDAGRSYFYRITDVDVKVLPVNNYSSTIEVKPGADGKGALVEWRGAFYRGYPNNDPPPELSDEAAEKAVTDLYRSGLGHLKELAEKGR